MAATKTSDNGIDVESLGKTVEIIKKEPEMGTSRFRVKNKWINGGHNKSTVQNFYSLGKENSHQQQFELNADEPSALGGTDQAPNPVEHLLNALASCVTTSMVAHAAVRGIHIEEVESELVGDIDLQGFLGLNEDVPKGYQNIEVRFKVKTDPENFKKLKSLAEFSPVYNTITYGANVDIKIEQK